MKFNRISQRILDRGMRLMSQIKSWRTERKIVVIESDDWGAIRMPDRNVLNNLLANGIRVDLCGYCSNDTLADKNDFEALYELLYSIKDCKGSPLKITANTIVANPDFDAIRKSNFSEYYYETLDQTFLRYPNRSLSYWREGIDHNIFRPQLHGREHVNVERWMRALRNGSASMKIAFDHYMYGLSSAINNDGVSYLEALNISEDGIKHHIESACDIFYDTFGYKSETFIAPNYNWTRFVEECLAGKGVFGLQGELVQIAGNSRIYHYLGEVNDLGQYYLTRNVVFEPALRDSANAVDMAFKQIAKAFDNNIPAVVCSHRVNFIGAINETNRIKNLKKLSSLFSAVLKRYPDTEFMFSDELFRLIKERR